MKKIILLLSLVISAISCNEDEISQPPYLNTGSTDVIPYQLVKISASNIAFEEEVYTATFGSASIKLAKNEQNELIFMVPDVAGGSHELKLSVENTTAILAFDVGINNPNTIDAVNENVLEALNNHRQYSLGIISQYNLSEEIENRLVSTTEMISDLEHSFAQTTDDEKEVLAKFFNANPIFTNTHKNLNLEGHKQSGEFLCFLINSARITGFSQIFYSWQKTLYPLLLSSEIIHDDIIKVFAVVGTYSFSTQIEASIALVKDFCSLPVSLNLYNENGNQNSFEIPNDTFYPLSFNIGVRNIISEDINNSDPMISDLVEKIDFVSENWDAFKTINPVLSDSFGWFLNWLIPSSNYESVASHINSLNQSSKIIEIDGIGHFLEFKNIPEDIGYEVQVINENLINLRFNADVSTLPQTFTIIAEYNFDSFQPLRKEIQVTLVEN